MYSILTAIGVGAVSGLIWTLLGLWKTWAMGIVLLFLVSIVTFIILTRVIAKRIEPIFDQVQKQVQGGNVKLALRTLDELMPLARWQVLLKGQLHAQMGSLAFTMGDEGKALVHLEQSSPRVADGQLFLASIYYRRKKIDAAKKTLETAISYGKKQMMLYNVYAWILVKEGDRDGAIEQLLRGLKVESGHEHTKDNLNRVQNGKKLNMKKFGMSWYGLQLEKLPAAMRQPQGQARAGFRQPRRRGR